MKSGRVLDIKFSKFKLADIWKKAIEDMINVLYDFV